MAVKKPGFKSLADQLADLEDPTPKGSLRSHRRKKKWFTFVNDICADFDPEDEDNGQQGSEEESGIEVDENAGREHYEKVR
jgi:protein AATF/BFR2